MRTVISRGRKVSTPSISQTSAPGKTVDADPAAQRDANAAQQSAIKGKATR